MFRSLTDNPCTPGKQLLGLPNTKSRDAPSSHALSNKADCSSIAIGVKMNCKDLVE